MNTELIAKIRTEIAMWSDNLESLEATGCDEIELEIATTTQLIAVLTEAADALEAAQPGKPVAWIDSDRLSVVRKNEIGAIAFYCNLYIPDAKSYLDNPLPLYTHPAPQVPMTEPVKQAPPKGWMPDALRRAGFSEDEIKGVKP